MELDKIAARVRPRSPWEAIDLGFAMGRHWFLPLWLLWLSLALPLYLLLVLFLPLEPFWVIFIIWWCKPMYEPLMLFWLSRALFGDRLSKRAVWSQWVRIVLPQLFANLTWRRFNPNRSFNMPVTVLERLKGKPRRQRINVLGRGQQAASWLTLVGIHFELALEISAMLFLVVMLPEELRWLDLQDFLFAPGRLEQWLQHLGNVLAMSLIAPFYVAAGFALYLARRTELEAWDIEIDFRRMASNARPARSGMRTVAALLLGTVLMTGAGQQDLQAAELDRESARETINQVLEDPVFGKKKEITYWHRVKYDEDGKWDGDGLEWLIDWIIEIFKGFNQGFAAIGKALLLILLGVALAWGLYRFLSNRDLLLRWRAGAANGRRQKSPPVTLFGLDLRVESLPDDLAGACRALCDQGDLRGALSLLYRGTLAGLLHRDALEVEESSTEGECLAQVRATCEANVADFFARLTRLWIYLAYAHRHPDSAQVEALCGEWQRLFAGEGADG